MKDVILKVVNAYKNNTDFVIQKTAIVAGTLIGIGFAGYILSTIETAATVAEATLPEVTAEIAEVAAEIAAV